MKLRIKFLYFLISASLLLSACNKNTADDKKEDLQMKVDTIKEKIDTTLDKSKEKIEDANKGVREGFDDTKENIERKQNDSM